MDTAAVMQFIQDAGRVVGNITTAAVNASLEEQAAAAAAEAAATLAASPIEGIFELAAGTRGNAVGQYTYPCGIALSENGYACARVYRLVRFLLFFVCFFLVQFFFTPP
jgi:hypothetical protein